MICTTLNKIRSYGPCESGWKKLLSHLGKTKADDEILPYSVILESNGLDDALWCMRTETKYENEWRTFALKCARRVEHLHPICKTTLDVLERFINGEATREDLAAAWAAESAARDAARDAADAAAGDAALAARAAALAARAAAGDAAEAAAGDAALAARDAADAAGDAAGDAAWAAGDAAEAAGAAARAAGAAARAAEREFQASLFLEIVGRG